METIAGLTSIAGFIDEVLAAREFDFTLHCDVECGGIWKCHVAPVINGNAYDRGYEAWGRDVAEVVHEAVAQGRKRRRKLITELGMDGASRRKVARSNRKTRS